MSFSGNSDSEQSPTPESFNSQNFSGGESLKNSLEPLRKALSQIRDGVLLVEMGAAHRLEIFYANEQVALIAGLPSSSELKDVAQLLAKESAFPSLEVCFNQAAKSGGATWVGDIKNGCTNKALPCEWRIRGVQNEHGKLLYFVVTLIEQARPSVKLPSVVNNESQRLRNDNLASLSLGLLHDLNNLLGIIMSNLSTSLHHQGDGGNTEFIRGALGAAQQARKYTSQVMRSARGLPINQELTDLEVLVREAANIAKSGSSVEIRVEVENSLKWAVVDAAEIAQVFQNLVINGIESMDRSGKMDIQLKNVQIPKNHKDLSEGAYVEILFRDRGVGMTPEELSMVNEGFFTTKEQGNGIGLITCRRIVQSHQGLLQISSMKNICTEVTVLLPAAPITSTLMQRKKDTGSHRTLKMGRGLILVVEDEEGLRQIGVNILKKCGYKCIEAATGSFAIDSYIESRRQHQEVDLVLMDLTLQGGISGENVMKTLRAINPEVKVVATSGSLVSESLNEYLEKGFCDILPKPFEAYELSEVVYRNLFGTSEDLI